MTVVPLSLWADAFTSNLPLVPKWLMPKMKAFPRGHGENIVSKRTRGDPTSNKAPRLMGDSFLSGPSHPDIHSRRRCVAAAACVDRSRIATGTPRTLCFPLPPTLDTIRDPAIHPTLHSTVLVFPLAERNTGIPGVARVGTTWSVWEKTGGWSPSCLQFRTSSVQFSDPLLRFSLEFKTLYGVRLHKEAKFQKDGALNSYLWHAPEWTS